MTNSPKTKTVFFLITDSEIYRTDEILKQIDHWIEAFKTGRLVRLPNVNQEAIDEFEAHLEQTLLESQHLAQMEMEFDF